MVSTPKKSKSTPKKSDSTPKKTPKKSASTPKLTRTPRSSKKLEESPEPEEETSPRSVVNFTSDDEIDVIQDVERLAHYKPTLPDIPEEDSDAHALLGKYSKTSNLIGNRIYDAQSYGFQTPKKSNSMMERTAQILQKCASPIPSRLLTPSRMREEIRLRNTTPLKDDSPEKSETTPSKRRSSVNGTKGGRSATVTPVKSRNGSASTTPLRSGAATPLGKLALSGEGPPTPMSTRRSLKRTLEKAKLRAREEEDEETSESSESEEESDESGSEDEVLVPAKKPAPAKETPTKTPTRGRKKIAIKENPENYFNSHSDGKIMTSDKTLSHLNTPRLSQDALRHMLSGEKMKFQPEIDQLMDEYKNSFPKWMLLLQENFNLLFYGLGSKRGLLSDFHTTSLSDRNVVVVNGFFPSLTLKQILNGITADLMETEVTFASPSEQVDYIFKNLQDDLYLIVHNIDGGMLRGDKNQSIIARLASHPKIHLICSIDHINAPLMWDQQKLSQFNFVWYDITTFLPYTEETLNENSLMVKQSGSLALNSLTRLFASLTPNAKEIYIIIVKYQMEGVKESGPQFYSGISFKDLYRVCRKAFLVNADLALRAQLTEFRDHKLIRSRKGTDGTEYLTIPLDNPTLQEFLEQQNRA